jgi:3-methyladenine DNA glycosylase AlkC
MRVVDEMRPGDYGLELCRWVLTKHARRLIASDAFAAALAEAAERIERQLATA